MGDTLQQDYKYSIPTSFGTNNGKTFVPNFLLTGTPWQYPQRMRESVGGYFGLDPNTVPQDIGSIYKSPIMGDRKLDPSSPWTGLVQKEPTQSLLQKMDTGIMNNTTGGKYNPLNYGYGQMGQRINLATGQPDNPKARQQTLKDMYAQLGITSI